jgi:hypothetical protein
VPSGGWTWFRVSAPGCIFLTAVESDGTGSARLVAADRDDRHPPPQAPPISAGFPIDGAAGPIGIAVSDADDDAAGALAANCHPFAGERYRHPD